jgi:CO/xanthine dehydrogenase FAD-binding subunit
MKTFDYTRASTLDDAIARSRAFDSRFLAGGTTLVDLMKCGVERPDRIVDISHLSGLNHIEVSEQHIHIGALAKMSQVAADPAVMALGPVLSESLWRAASPQIRNMATIGGNLMQRTRCTYFRDPLAYGACNKRNPGSGCAALAGINRNHAILGVSEACIASYPGDFAVALMAFDARVRIRGHVDRSVPLNTFFRLPADRPDLEHDLLPDEIIVGVDVPITAALKRSHYLKVRDRASYEFAAASAAVGLELEADGRTIRDVRVALGGVATKPWRATNVEQALAGQILDESNIRSASARAVDSARGHGHNDFKITLVPRVIARALLVVGGLA